MPARSVRYEVYAQVKPGRACVIRLEHGDVLHEEIERFCEEQSIRAAALLVVGGADEGSRLVVGPERGDQVPIVPQIHVLTGAHEVTGTGTVFWDQAAGRPTAHAPTPAFPRVGDGSLPANYLRIDAPDALWYVRV